MLGVRIVVVGDGHAVLAAIGTERPANFPGVILLDARLRGISDGRLLAAIQESGVHRECAIALIAAQAGADRLISEKDDENFAVRLKEGFIDDIVPRNADAATWSTHLSTMQRVHRLHCELEETREAATMQIEHDRLTGVLSRDTMVSILFRETDRVQRLNGTLCVVLLDIDDFSQWNREYGTAACDELLRQVAARIGKMLRSYDLLGRMGRDEFLLALPGCSPASAVTVSERLQVEVFGELFAIGAGEDALQIRLSACIGIAASGGRSPMVVLREAEAALAHARGCGVGTIRCGNAARMLASASSKPMGLMLANQDIALW